MRATLEPPAGLVSDETTYSAPGLWEDGDLIRFWRGRPETWGGWAKYHAVALTGVARSALLWFDSDQMQNIAFGTHEALQVLYDDTLYDITPANLPAGNEDYADAGAFGEGGFGMGPFGGGGGVDSAPRTWSLDNYGAWLLACPRYDGIYLWQNDTGTPAALLTNAPTAVDTMIVTDTRQVGAFGTLEVSSGEYNAMCVRFSDIEDITDWTPTAVNNADEIILQEGSRIVRAAQMNNYLLCWTDTALYMATFQDVTTQPWRFDLIGTNCGLSNALAMTVSNGVAYWLTPANRFFRFQIETGLQEIVCPISRDFTDNLDTVEIDKVTVFPVPKYQEIWWSYPDTRDGNECSRILVHSILDGTWSKGTIARSAFVQSARETPILVSPEGYIYEHETGETADGSALSWYIKATGQYFDEGERVVMVRDVRPDFEAQSNSVNLTFYTQAYPQASEASAGTYTLAAGREKRDLRVTGRIIAQKFAGTGFARFGKPTYDIRIGGRR